MGKSTVIFFIVLNIISTIVKGQKEETTFMTSKADPEDYFFEIPQYPGSYTSENVAARLVDGLGFRFYWASEGLSQPDLEYKPGESSRSTAETIDHIYGLTLTIVNATLNKPNVANDRSGLTTDDKRRLALENIKAASENLKNAASGDIENMNVIFQNGSDITEFPFWNMINGPIADAIYHTGQIVAFRRASGNPINPNISVLQGKVFSR